MSLASVNRLESVEIHIAIQTAEEAKNEPSSPQDKFNRVLPRLASRKSSQAAAIASITPPESPIDEFRVCISFEIVLILMIRLAVNQRAPKITLRQCVYQAF